jgi:integrase
VTTWVNTRYAVTDGYSDSVRWQAQKVAVLLFRWATAQGLLAKNPLEGFKKSTRCGKRGTFLKHADYLKLIEACEDDDFKNLLTLLWETGARPQELFQAQAKHLERIGESGRLVFRKAAGDNVKKHETRIVWLNPTAFAIVAKLAERYPAGPLLRNGHGRKYTTSGSSQRFARLAKVTGVTTSLYEFRHGFAHHHATVKKTDIATLAALMGHSSTKMLVEVYSHVDANSDHMLRAVA